MSNKFKNLLFSQDFFIDVILYLTFAKEPVNMFDKVIETVSGMWADWVIEKLFDD